MLTRAHMPPCNQWPGAGGGASQAPVRRPASSNNEIAVARPLSPDDAELTVGFDLSGKHGCVHDSRSEAKDPRSRLTASATWLVQRRRFGPGGRSYMKALC